MSPELPVQLDPLDKHRSIREPERKMRRFPRGCATLLDQRRQRKVVQTGPNRATALSARDSCLAACAGCFGYDLTVQVDPKTRRSEHIGKGRSELK